MHAKHYLKVVLRFWGYAFFGTTTHFYEMHTVRPLLDQMLVTSSFKNKISIFVQFLSKICLFFLLIPSPYDSINARNDSFLHRINIGWFWCNFKGFFYTFWKVNWQNFTNYFQESGKNLQCYCKNQTNCCHYQAICHIQQILSHMGSKLEEKVSIILTKIEILIFETVSH